MAKTKQELTDFLAARLFQTNYQELTYSDLATTISNLPQDKKDKLMSFVLEGKELQVGQFLHNLMIELAKTNAATEAASLMSDDNLTLTEMQRIFV